MYESKYHWNILIHLNLKSMFIAYPFVADRTMHNRYGFFLTAFTFTLPVLLRLGGLTGQFPMAQQAVSSYGTLHSARHGSIIRSLLQFAHANTMNSQYYAYPNPRGNVLGGTRCLRM